MIIYLATSPSGKHYVGQTVRELSWRWGQHRNKTSKTNTHMGAALRKYPAAEWNVRVIWRCDSQEMLDLMEEHFIDVLGDYNMAPGGRSGSPSEETREKLRIAQTGKKASAETRAKLSAALSGRTPTSEHRAALSKANRGKGGAISFKGRKHSPETIEKMRASQRARMAKRKADGLNCQPGKYQAP